MQCRSPPTMNLDRLEQTQFKRACSERYGRSTKMVVTRCFEKLLVAIGRPPQRGYAHLDVTGYRPTAWCAAFRIKRRGQCGRIARS